MAIEQTYVMLKPDAMQRGLCGEIVSRFERKGFKIVAAKMFRFTTEIAKVHYAHHVTKPFFPALAEFMSSSPVFAFVLEGKDAVNQVRLMCGPTDCGKASAGTIRGDLGLSMQENLIHASDSVETAKQEIARFFKPEEVMSYSRAIESYVHAKDEM